jgi:hypothetical protein
VGGGGWLGGGGVFVAQVLHREVVDDSQEISAEE